MNYLLFKNFGLYHRTYDVTQMMKFNGSFFFFYFLESGGRKLNENKMLTSKKAR